MGKCKGTILLSISNEQSDYAKCMESLQNIQREGVSAKINFINVNIFPYETLNTQTVKKMVIEDGGTENPTNLTDVKLTDYNILFVVLCNDDENDIVNLQYFFLTKKWLIKKANVSAVRIGLYIKSSQIDEKGVYALYYKATEFLTYQCKDNTPYFIDYWRKYGKDIDIKRIEPKSDVILRRFSPLIEIVDIENMGIGYWQQTMGDFIERCQKKCICWEEIDSFTVLKADKNNAHTKKNYELENQIRNKIENQRKACSDWDYRLMLILKECFCTQMITVARNRMKFCNSPQFKECIQEMSLLSFYIFCLFEYNSAANKGKILPYEDDIILLSQIALKMRDIGDGFFQLMQNTVEHSEFSTGYFYFRIHEAVDNNYLENKYKKYVETQKDNTDFFLEMQLIDYSTLDVPNKFVHNMKNRAAEIVDDDDKEKYSELIGEGRQINLSTFFRPNEEETKFWDKYYQISDNIVHHYGLQLFDSVIDSNNGCFLAISTPEYQIQNVNQNFYCSFETLENPAESYHIPGTQYSALLPLHYVEQTEYTAVNADINYTELVSQSFFDLKMQNVSKKKIEETLAKHKDDVHLVEKTIKELSENLVDKESVQSI